MGQSIGTSVLGKISGICTLVLFIYVINIILKLFHWNNLHYLISSEKHLLNFNAFFIREIKL